MAQKMFKNRMRFNYKQYKHRLWDTGDMALQNVTVEYQFLAIAEIFEIPTDKYITLASNYCGCRGIE